MKICLQATEFIKNKFVPSSNILEGGDASSAQYDPTVDMDTETIESDLQPEHIVHEVEEVRSTNSVLLNTARDLRSDKEHDVINTAREYKERNWEILQGFWLGFKLEIELILALMFLAVFSRTPTNWMRKAFSF